MLGYTTATGREEITVRSLSETPHDPDDPSHIKTIDTTVPSIARAYSYMIGGKEHYQIDRDAVDGASELMGDVRSIAIVNREWLIRIVRFLAKNVGITQFLDCGSGLPESQNVHQVAQHYNPDSIVIYTDTDPTVQAHGRALLAENENTAFIDIDLREPEKFFAHPIVQEKIDFDQPIALIQCATLHHVPDEPRSVSDIMAVYRDHLPSGSYLALTHIMPPPAEHDPDGTYRELASTFHDRITKAGMDSGYWREYDHVQSFFDGFELVEPGMVLAADWWPDGPVTYEPIDRIMYSGVAKKP